MDKNNVLIAVNKVHDRFGGVAVGVDGRIQWGYYGKKHFISNCIKHMAILLCNKLNPFIGSQQYNDMLPLIWKGNHCRTTSIMLTLPFKRT